MSAAIDYYKNLLIHRYDDNGYIKYFSVDDFEGLLQKGVRFLSGKNLLQGYFYQYDGCKEDELIIFCHGIGGGHRSYLTKIELLCRKGYPVFAYDNTGCFESEGESMICLSQSLADLNSAVEFLKAEGIFQKYRKVFVIGHSLGGYAAGNIAEYQEGIDRVVVLSGFISVKQMLRGLLRDQKALTGRLLLYRLCKYEKKMGSRYFNCSLLRAVNNGKTKFLLAHSTDDPTVPYADNTGFIKDSCKNSDVKYLICENKKHNPNYTEDAVNDLNEIFSGFNKALSEKKLETLEAKKAYFKDVDWVKITRQDEEFWEKVLDFLRGEEERLKTSFNLFD